MFAAVSGELEHKKRRQMCPLYASGLIRPGDREGIEPMAERFAPGKYDRLHFTITFGVLYLSRPSLLGRRTASLVHPMHSGDR
jgi:SRSO17 transposase